jgi:nitrogen fixation protein FixH
MTAPTLTQQSAPSTHRRFTGWHMLAILVAFFGVVIVVNVVMARLAVSTFSGEVVENSYVASQNYNSWLDRARAEKALGWTARVVPAGQGASLTLTDFSGHALAGARIAGNATHPLGADTDLPLRFVETQPGTYVAPLPAGRWQLHLLIHANGHDLHQLDAVTIGAGQ